jgi:ABC-2 type transport system ATP-binding protein
MAQPVSTFSGGMKRRLNLAAGILHQPKLLFLDEPTVGIDAQSRNLIMKQLETLKETGTTMVYTTHYMEEAELICDRVAIVDEGRRVALGTPTELIQKTDGCDNLEDLFLQLTGKRLRD